MKEDIRDMRRSDWHRILEREYKASPCVFQGMEGVVSLLQIKKVDKPLTVRHEFGEVLIADAGYAWLQVAFKEQLFWATHTTSVATLSLAAKPRSLTLK